MSRAHFPRGVKFSAFLIGMGLASALAFSQSANVPLGFMQGTQVLHEGKLEEAAAGFAAAAKRQPTFAEAYLNLGLADEELGKYEEAIASLREALKLKPRLHGANLFLAISEFRLSRLDEAGSAAQK